MVVFSTTSITFGRKVNEHELSLDVFHAIDLTPCKIYFESQVLIHSMSLVTFVHVQQSNFGNIEWFLSSTQKCLEKSEKLPLPET